MRQLIVEIITDEETDSHRAHVYDTYMTIVILASLLPLCFKEMTDFFKYLEWVTTTVFIIDYLLRWSCADLILKNKRFAFVRYPFSPMALIDLVSIVPTFLPVSQVLRLSRIIRLLRIMRALRFASAFLAVGATAYGLLMGVSLSEAALALTVFLLLNMGVRK